MELEPRTLWLRQQKVIKGMCCCCVERESRNLNLILRATPRANYINTLTRIYVAAFEEVAEVLLEGSWGWKVSRNWICIILKAQLRLPSGILTAYGGGRWRWQWKWCFWFWLCKFKSRNNVCSPKPKLNGISAFLTDLQKTPLSDMLITLEYLWRES